MRDESKPAYLEQLTERLNKRTAVIGIIGLGYRVWR
jgi:UDP-N-acetyl-D-glucosamine dehydrogenase